VVAPKNIRNQILAAVRSSRGCQLDDLMQRCPDLTWYQVLTEMDMMSRAGQLQVTALEHDNYKLTLPKAPRKKNPPRVSSRKTTRTTG